MLLDDDSKLTAMAKRAADYYEARDKLEVEFRDQMAIRESVPGDPKTVVVNMMNADAPAYVFYDANTIEDVYALAARLRPVDATFSDPNAIAPTEVAKGTPAWALSSCIWVYDEHWAFGERNRRTEGFGPIVNVEYFARLGPVAFRPIPAFAHVKVALKNPPEGARSTASIYGPKSSDYDIQRSPLKDLADKVVAWSTAHMTANSVRDSFYFAGVDRLQKAIETCKNKARSP